MNSEEDEIKKILKCVAKKLGIKKWHYELNSPTGDTGNFLGTLNLVQFVDETTGKDVHLVIKVAPRLPRLDDLMNEVYRREVFMYTKVLPIFRSMDTGTNYKKLFPNCYYADLTPSHQVLVMNDMKYLGFIEHNGKYLDPDHVNVSLRAIAQYHALSIIASENNMKPNNDYDVRPILSNDPECYVSLQKWCVVNYKNVFKNMKYRNYMVELLDNIDRHIDESVLKAKRLVYGHGDMWKANILFEYMDNKPIRACLVDFQLSRLMSPAHDVIFLIMTAVDSSTRLQSFHSFLETYYSELQKCLHGNNLDISLVYSKKDFHHDLKLVFPYCFIVTLMSLIMWLGLESTTSIPLKTKNNIPKEERKSKEEILENAVGNLITDFEHLGYITVE